LGVEFELVVVPVVVIDHLVAAAETIAKVLTLVARAIRVAEIVVPIWIRWFVGIYVVACGFNSIVKTAVPG
jgi:hypothetical protein